MQHPKIIKDVLKYEYIDAAIRAYQRQLTFDLAVRLGEGIGWTLDSDQGKGSHQCLRREGVIIILSHPNGDTYLIGTARRILKDIFQPLVDSGELKTHEQEKFVQDITEHVDETLTWLGTKALVSLQSLQENYQQTLENLPPELAAAETLVDELQAIIDKKDQQLAQLSREIQQVQTEQEGMAATTITPELQELGSDLELGVPIPENVDLDSLMSDLMGDQSSGDLRQIQGGLTVDEEIARISDLASTEVFSRNQALEQQIQELTAQIEQLQAERQEVQTQLDAAQSLVQTLQEQIQNLETTAIAHDELQQTNAELRNQVQQLQEQEAQRQELEDHVSHLTREQASLQEQLTQLETTNQTLQQQLEEQSAADLDTGDVFVPQPSDLESELEQVRQHLQEIQAEKVELQATIEHLNETITQLHQSIDTSSVSAAVDTDSAVETEDAEEIDQNVEAIEQIEEQAVLEGAPDLAAQVKDLTQQLAVSQAAVKPLQERIASLQAQLAEASGGEAVLSTDVRQEQQLNRRLKRQARRQGNVIWIATLVSALIVALPMVPQWLRPFVVLSIPVSGAIAKKVEK